MAILNVCELSSDRSATSLSTGIPEYTQTFRVLSDTDLDGPRTIATASDGTTTIPAEGATYASGNDVDTRSLLIRKTPTRVYKQGGTGWVIWTVTCEYGEWPNKDKDDDDPTQWTPELDITGYLEFADTPEAVFRGADVGQAGAPFQNCPTINLTIGDKSVPVNTAFVPYTQKLQKSTIVEKIRLAWWSLTYDKAGYDPFKNALNSVDWIVSWPGLAATYAARTLRCDSIGGAWTRENNQDVFKITAEFTYREEGWDQVRESEGFMQLVGGIKYEHLKDGDGNLLTEPAPLDINGESLLDAADKKAATVQMHWQTTIKEAAFATIPGLPFE